jgi:hypothetical protein
VPIIEVVPAVKIPAQRSGWLGFDLSDILAAIGEHPGLVWQVQDANFAFDDEAVSDSWQAVAYDSRMAGGVDIKWGDLEQLAAAHGQVVEGRFTGFDGNHAMVQLAAFGNSHWTVWARNPSILERIHDAFLGVEECDVREPHR